MAAFLSWIFDPKNAVQVSAWGVLFGIMGTILTIVGFGLTAWQLWRTANATKAAARAVANIKSRVATYDAIFEISRATSSLRETEKHLKRHNWPEAIDSYYNFRHAIVRIVELPSSLNEDQRGELRAMHKGATFFSERLEKAVANGKAPGDISKAIINNRKCLEALAVVSIHLEGAQ